MEPAATSQLMMAAVVNSAIDIQNFDAVVEQYWPRIFRFALASLRDKDAAETIAQDCFLKAFRGRDRFRGESTLSTWLMQIAVNLVRDHVRNRRLQFWKQAQATAVDMTSASDTVRDQNLSPEARALVKERVQAVWTATEQLSQRQRTVFLLRFVEDMDLLEICEVTGMKEGAVKVHLFRAVRAVRERLGRAA
jgi:RNA polymerase sigma-70 factor (ECF subfamily)